MAKDNKKQDEKNAAPAQATRSLNDELYDEYAKGGVINEMADAHGIDSRELLAIIQEVQASKRSK